MSPVRGRSSLDDRRHSDSDAVSNGMTEGWESLHNHTVISDGSQEHLEFLKTSEKYDYGVVAFTDHDQVPDGKVLKQLQAYTGPVRWLIGVELSARLGDKYENEGSVHMLGLFVDPTDKTLVSYCDDVRQRRIERTQHIVKHLQQIGFKITEQDCFEIAGASMIGSPHIVKAVHKYPENKKLETRLMKQMEKAAKDDEELDFIYQRMLDEGPNQIPYVLYMKKTSFISMPPAPSFGDLPDIPAASKIIRNAGGISAIAHWWYEQDKLTKTILEEKAAKHQIDGLEVDAANDINERDITEESEYLHKLAKQHSLYKMMGADAHTPSGIEFYAKSKVAAKSVGHTAKIVSKARPDLTWSNL